MSQLTWPLMKNNITRSDLDVLIEFLKGDPILTQSRNVKQFEQEWAKWLGVKYCVFVNSGASANLLTMAALKHLKGEGEVIVPTLTWVSDIASVMQAGLTPVFVDIDENSLGMDVDQVIAKMNSKTRAVFLTHVLGFNGLTDRLKTECEKRGVLLIEDVCESHGATHKGKRLGSLGFASNFSFYYAHHMTTIEGGMVCTNDEEFYETIRMLRSHGMIREASSETFRQKWITKYPNCNPEFIFSYPAYNVRSTEINAVLGLHQLKKLDENNLKRIRNFDLFLKNLNGDLYKTDFFTEGSSNYAFTLIIKKADEKFCTKVMSALKDNGIEFRRGLSGGGNQLRQPFVQNIVAANYHREFPRVEHVHSYGFYIGNYPELAEAEILRLCKILNDLK